jgi:hypothetical protein
MADTALEAALQAERREIEVQPARRDAPMGAVGEAPLPLLLAVLGEFRRRRLDYGYWRSRRRLPVALSGRSDLDLLIARTQQHRACAILLDSGFKHFPDLPHREEPGVSSWLGYDEASGRIVHLHLHFRLVLGPPLLKTYRLPWEAALLRRAEWHPSVPVRVLDAASEALLLAVRASTEASAIDPVALHQRRARRQKFEADRQDLRPRLERASLRALAGEVLAADVADLVADACFSPQPLARQLRLRRGLRRELSAYRVCSPVEAQLRLAARAVLWAAGAINKRFLHMPRPYGRRAPAGGCVAAVVGVDGSGKSTVTAALRAWLGAEIDVMPVYFGTGAGRPGLLLLPFKPLVPLVRRLFPVKPRGASHGRVSDRDPGPLYSLLLAVWAIAAAAEKRMKLRAAYRAAGRGLVVVADRYPQNEDADYSDGPLLPRLRRVPRRLRYAETRIYALAGRLAPDLVLSLEVTPQTAARREPDMDAAVIRTRIAALRRLVFGGARVVPVDAERPLAEVIRSLKKEIWSLL